MKIRIFFLLAVVFWAAGAWAQNTHSNLIQKKIAVRTEALQFDTLSIVPQSFSMPDVPDSFYQVDLVRAVLRWKNFPSEKDSVAISYRRLPLNLAKTYSHKNPSIIDSNVAMGNPYVYSPSILGKPSDFVPFNSIDYNGSYGRSLSIGNNQDVVLNSQFNLQLNGYVLDSVRIEAAITDNNIPFQPEGNTQRLQEFDRMFITFQKGFYKLTAGDYILDRPPGYFLNFNKKVQGLMFEGRVLNKPNVQNDLRLSGSLAKGVFTRNMFQGLEGNQGPYKLTGLNGEQFFVVLAGSERVFIDGELMRRGEDLDYIIDYNTAELTFMPRRLITKDKRIQVEFEYQNRNYLNTLLFASDELRINKKWIVRANVYADQDAKNQQYMQLLSSDQKRFLSGIGDRIDQAFYPSIVSDTFAANKILYKIIDTVVDGVYYDSVFVYSVHPDSARYNLTFTYVGEGNGNYIVSDLNTNGRSYTWLAPQQGKKMGAFEPMILLITPKKQQLFTLGTVYQIDSLKQVSVEMSSSNYSPNTFSRINNKAHWGFAGRAAYHDGRYFGSRDSTGQQLWKWITDVTYESVSDKYKAIAPYRNVEFARDWNVDTATRKDLEHLAGLSTKIEKLNLGHIAYGFNYFQRGAAYRANKNELSFLVDHQKWRAAGQASLMNSRDVFRESRFLRPTFFLERILEEKQRSLIGLKYFQENNEMRPLGMDSLLPTAYKFDESKIYLQKNGPLKLDLSYMLRRDFVPLDSRFVQKNHGHTIETNLVITSLKDQQISFTGSYRKLQVDDSTLSKEEAGSTFLGRLAYEGNIRKGFLVSNLIFDFGTGQEPKRQFTYVEVPVGQGVYVWNDYNGDGVQQANEFEIALYNDQKRFIRVMNPSNEYIKANFSNLNVSIALNPENLWKVPVKKGFGGFVSRFSDQLALQIANKSLYSAGIKTFNPFATDIVDTAIISALTTISNTLFFNRNSTRWGLDYSSSFNAAKALLTYGLEAQSYLRHIARLRWMIHKQLTFQTSATEGYRRFLSPIPDGRTYKINYLGLEPSLTFLYSSSWRLLLHYKIEDRRNEASLGGERASVHQINFDNRISFPNTGIIQMRGSYAHIRYDGQPNTPLSFTILESLQAGSNWLWYLNWSTRLSKSIELSLEYEGRKAGTTRTVHTGTMSIRAIL